MSAKVWGWIVDNDGKKISFTEARCDARHRSGSDFMETCDRPASVLSKGGRAFCSAHEYLSEMYLNLKRFEEGMEEDDV